LFSRYSRTTRRDLFLLGLTLPESKVGQF
jgi:hypothetical protein